MAETEYVAVEIAEEVCCRINFYSPCKKFQLQSLESLESEGN